MKNKESGQSRGFGFVTFSDPNMVYEVLKKGPHVIDGRAVSVLEYYLLYSLSSFFFGRLTD